MVAAGLARPAVVGAETPGLTAAGERALKGRNLPRYEIQLDLRTNPTRFNETVVYRGVCEADCQRLYFEILPNTPRYIGGGKPQVAVTRVTVDDREAEILESDGLVELRPDSPVPTGKAFVVRFEATGTVPDQTPGKTELFVQAMDQLLGMLMRNESSDYGLYSVGDGIISLVRFFPAYLGSRPPAQGGGRGDARTLELADYDVTLTAPGELAVASTGVILRSAGAGPGRTVHSIRSPACRDLALVLSDRFAVQVAAVGPVLVRSFHDRAHEMEGRLALTTAVQALQLFTDRFGPYPYTELDVVEAPIYGGAAGMEFPGLVTIANLFYRPIRLPWSSGTIAEVVRDLRPMLHETQEFVVAHEVAHQWWNATVASDAVQFPFLDESLANFSALLYFERMYGRRVAARHAFVDLRLNYLLHRMAGGADAPVNLPVTGYATGLQYAAVVYGKGGLFYLALRRLIGDAAFFAALRDYYQSHYLKVATPAELEAAILRHSPDAGSAKALYVRWIEETHGDEDLGTLTAMGLFKAALAINLRAARGEDLPRDPVVLLRQLIEDAAQ